MINDENSCKRLQIYLLIFNDVQNKIVETLCESHVFIGKERIVWDVGIILVSTNE